MNWINELVGWWCHILEKQREVGQMKTYIAESEYPSVLISNTFYLCSHKQLY